MYLANCIFNKRPHYRGYNLPWWRSLDLHFSTWEYFDFKLIMEDDLKLVPERYSPTLCSLITVR